MLNSLTTVLGYSLLPVLAATIGALIAVFRPPSGKLRSVVQHFAAGVVFSVVAVELLPDVIKIHNIFATTIGFALGVAAMIGIKYFVGEGETEESGELPKAMLFAVGVDVVIDGFLLGIGFATGQKEGKLLALALTMEFLSLGLAIVVSLQKAKLRASNIILLTAGLCSLIFIGAIIGVTLLPTVPHSIMEGVLSFGLAALLYLVTEELLMEAHEEPETPLITSTFFIGFLLFLILGMME